MAVLVAELANPTGYGRILRDAEGKVAAIVEQKDANDEQRRIRTINTGILTAESTALRRWLAGLSNDNAQAEFYLTDVFASAAADFTPADMVHVADPQDVEVPTTRGNSPSLSVPGSCAPRARFACRACAWPTQRVWSSVAACRWAAMCSWISM